MTKNERSTIILGVLGGVLLLMLGYFFLISPQNGDTASLNSQKESVTRTNQRLQEQINVLKMDSSKLDEFKAQLETEEQALPTSAELTTFVRNIVSSASSAPVNLTSMTVGSPVSNATVGAAVATGTTSSTGTTAAAPAAGLYSIPIGVTTVGSADQLQAFLAQLQKIQPRATLINQTDLQAGTDAKSINSQSIMKLSVSVFVSPSTAAEQLHPAGK
ncbi:Tfp pilus assembly protein PilO [Jatrophihabitans sp. GAS493]|uniref:GspMb/PilO family protein n=1 Tax=Jatrophihabitans sp. GAS493 TaxID=1907575 RepID=UPI000BB9BA10|nr:GspMb/PilO family protein [Jatrophihabitans sp. GAS493]SOD74778.1 Tfp pilus assembly protein PilO [Jatrophihabitans sp. GAS493]